MKDSEINITMLPYNKIDDFPETVYKYRIWKDLNHKDMIKKQIVFVAAPSSFLNDKYDCNLKTRYDLLNDIEIYNKYFENSKLNNQTWTRQQHRKHARNLLKNSPLRNTTFLNEFQTETYTNFDNHMGVLSLTPDFKNEKMWNLYAENHAGFCVGFDSKKMFQNFDGGGNVNYFEILPDIFPLENNIKKYVKNIFSKQINYSFENEYRVYKSFNQYATIYERQIKIPKDCFKEIIFGAQLSKYEIDEIIEICKEQELKVVFYKELIIKDIIEIKPLYDIEYN